MYQDDQEDPAGTDGEDLTSDGPLAAPLAVRGPMDANRASLQALYDEGSKRLTSTYRNSARNELLLALGAALLQPTAGGTFKESLSNVPSALLSYSQGRRQKDEAHQDALLKLMTQYDIASARGGAPTTLEREYEYLKRMDPSGKLAAQYLAAKANPQMAVQGINANGQPTVTFVPRGGSMPGSDGAGGPPPDSMYGAPTISADEWGKH
jgi:hypothetical protein